MRVEWTINAAAVAAGTLILALGLVVAAVSASSRLFSGVFAGFLIASLGYKMTQYSTREQRSVSLDSLSSDVLRVGHLLHLFMVLVGSGTIAYGFIRMFKSMRDVSIELALYATIIMFVGYAITHYGVNNSLI